MEKVRESIVLVEGVEELGNRVWRDERDFLIKEDHTEEDKIKKLLYSQDVSDIKLALKIVKKRKAELDLLYTFDFVRIEPGKFPMGTGKKMTNIPDAYYINKYMLTQGLWLAIMGTNPSKYQGDLRLPVENMEWEQIKEFIGKLAFITGLPIRMPFEKEWEYAADGGHMMPKDKNGNVVPDVWGGFSDIKDAPKYAWYNENSNNEPHPVGQLLPNRLGLYDITGNMFEYTLDDDDDETFPEVEW